MTNPIRKTITWTIIQTVLYNSNTNQCDSYKVLKVPMELTNDEAREYMQNNSKEQNIIMANVRYETKYHEISFEDFLTHSKEITEKQFKYYYRKKK